MKCWWFEVAVFCGIRELFVVLKMSSRRELAKEKYLQGQDKWENHVSVLLLKKAWIFFMGIVCGITCIECGCEWCWKKKNGFSYTQLYFQYKKPGEKT